MRTSRAALLISMLLACAACTLSAEAPPGDDGNISGSWTGQMRVRGETYRIVLWVEDVADRAFGMLTVLDRESMQLPAPGSTRWFPIAGANGLNALSPCTELLKEANGTFSYATTAHGTIDVAFELRVSYQAATDTLVGQWAGNTAFGGDSGTLELERLSRLPTRMRISERGNLVRGLLGCVPRVMPQCDDGLDNDGDGLIDDDDPSCCSSGSICIVDGAESATTTCDDGLDNDGDGLTDDDDAECAASGVMYGVEAGREPACADGWDNDRDGLIDLDDPDCGGDRTRYAEHTIRPRCNDGIDNDADGFTDDADPDCATLDDEAADLRECNDRVDNDGDGLADELDPACIANPARGSEQGAGRCDDGIDNDGDGLLDLDEPGCSRRYGTRETGDRVVTASDCDDGVDNDGDGLTDALDPDCVWFGVGDELEIVSTTKRIYLQCANGLDDDGDGLVDSDDPSCAREAFENPWLPFEGTPPCLDGVDNDGDGLVDFDDPQCTGLDAQTETAPCADGVDNDGDGTIDLDDASCDGDPRASEMRPECDDGVDNDGDGLRDVDDPDCASAADEHEAPACDDGLDNDRDGYYDLADPDCDDAQDTDERRQ